MSKHTPVRLDGKGLRRDTINGGEFVPLLGSNGEWLADVRAGFHKQIVQAINHSDELLEACEAALEFLDAIDNTDDWPPMLDLMLRKAIAKATGATP